MGILILLIIILVLLLAIIIAAYCGYSYLKKRTQQFSREMFGTDDIRQAASQMKKDYATTPKSVSGMTSLLLPKITADFPDFEYNEMKERANNVLTSYLRAVTANKVEMLQDGNTELKNQLRNHIEMLAGKGLNEHFDQIHIHRTEINQYRKTAGRCIITFQSAVECFHYITDSSNDIKEGEKEYKYQTKFNTDMIYIQDREKVETDLDGVIGLNCPNCGAPLSSLGAKFCQYCGTGILELNIHAWSFSNIDEIR